MGCIMVRIIERKQFELYNKMKSLNNDSIEKANLYQGTGIVNQNIDTLIMSYFNCSNRSKIQRALNNQKYSEGTLENKVDTVLNNVFLLLTSLCEFTIMKIVKPFTIHLFYQFVINLIQRSLITCILTIMMNCIKQLLSVHKSDSVSKFKNGIDHLIRPFIMEIFFGRIWFNIVDGTENYKAFKHILWNGFEINLVFSNQ